MKPELNRREWLAAVAATAVPPPASNPLPILLMSKFLQFLDIPKMGAMTAELGFDGVDLCVRRGAHVLPERAADDLPRAVEEIRKAGSAVGMITSDIADAATPHAEQVLKTIKALGIRHYRWGGLRYDLARPIAPQLEAMRPRVKELAALNREYGVTAMYHTHSGPREVGGGIWDMWYLLKDFNPDEVAFNYDIGHATVEGGYGGWVHTSRLAMPLTRGVAIKDFLWGRNEKGDWAPQWKPLGEGMVNVRAYLALLKAAAFSGPVQLHFEYPLGGIDQGSRRPTIPLETAWAAMRRDLALLRRWMREA
jgi:sugar phosphate isomerase/epimerase